MLLFCSIGNLDLKYRSKTMSTTVRIPCVFLNVATLCIATLLVACAGTEGVFEPACIAYEGDRIELRNGRFEWHRFTDQRNVDSNGDDVEPFPDYPKNGRYKLQDGQVRFDTDEGVRLPDYFLHKQRGRHYLLTEEQRKSLLGGAEIPACALRLVEVES